MFDVSSLGAVDLIVEGITRCDDTPALCISKFLSYPEIYHPKVVWYRLPLANSLNRSMFQ